MHTRCSCGPRALSKCQQEGSALTGGAAEGDGGDAAIKAVLEITLTRRRTVGSGNHLFLKQPGEPEPDQAVETGTARKNTILHLHISAW